MTAREAVTARLWHGRSPQHMAVWSTLSREQRSAVTRLVFEIKTGRAHEATSLLDLTVDELVAEMNSKPVSRKRSF